MERLLTVLTVFSAFVVSPVATAENVEIKPMHEHYLLRIGAVQELNCSVNATETNSKLVWNTPTWDGVTERQISSIIQSKKVTLSSSLKIDHFSASNAGEYKCSLDRDGVQVSEAVIHLNAVKEDKSEPLFVLGMKTATLSCEIEMGVNTNHITHMSWFKNDQIVSGRKDSVRFETVVPNNTLIIHNPIRDDSGLYIARFDISSRTQPYDCHVHFRATPLVLDFEKSKSFIEGDDMELHCVVKGYPHAEVTWYKGNDIVNASTGDDNRITLQELNGYKNARLFIRRVDDADAGEYRCEAYSSYFSNSTSTKKLTIRIKDKLAALWPFLGIVGEVVVLCIIIFIYERRRNKQVQMEDNAARDVDGATVDKKEGLRHRNTNNPSA